MYTSGSTGKPKGVMLTHGNVVCATRSFPKRIGKFEPNTEIYIAYLPLAHILELVCELSCVAATIRLGYSSPFTLTDNSTGIKKGQTGDILVLKPSVMTSVPLVLERICKAITDKVDKGGDVKRILFKMAFNQKLNAIKNERKTRLLDKLVFNKLKKAVHGGKLKYIYCGGALLNEDVQKFFQVCIAPVVQAYVSLSSLIVMQLNTILKLFIFYRL